MQYFQIFLICICLLTSCSEDAMELSTQMDCHYSLEERNVISELSNDFIHPFESASPDFEEPNLTALTEYLGQAKIVGLGEATHGSAEFFEMKDKIFRELVNEKDFKAIVFEIPWGNCLLIDEYVTNNIGTSDEALNQSYYWVYDTEETRALADWMNNYNIGLEQEDKIHFVGCDPQGGNFEIEKEVVQAYVNRVSSVFFDSVYIRYADLPVYDIKEYHTLPEEQQLENKINTKWVYDFIYENREAFVSQTGSYDYEVALMASHVIQHREKMYRLQSFGETRDSLMAIYSLWWQRILGKNSKIGVWAHNYHVMDNPASGAKWMGSFLRDSLSDDYKNVAFSFGKGSLNAFVAGNKGQFVSGVRVHHIQDYHCKTVNALLSEINAELFYLIFDEMEYGLISSDYFEEPHDMYNIGAGFNYDLIHRYTSKLSVSKLWDVLIYFDEVNASKLR